MTDEQYKIAKEYYQRLNKEKSFEHLRLYQMNEWLEKAIIANNSIEPTVTSE